MPFSRPPLSYIPLLPILAGIVAGVLCCRYLPISPWVTAGVALAMAVMAVLLHRPLAVEILLALSLGVVATCLALPRQFDAAPARDTVMSGCVADVWHLPECQRICVNVNGADASSYRTMLTFPVFDTTVEAGDIIRFSGTYSLPRRSVDLPMEDDMADYYYTNRISMLCYVPKGNMEVIGRSGNPLYLLKRLREKTVDRIFASGLDEPAAAFLAAILTGDTTALTDDSRSDYAAAGVAHILALSGAHVAVIAMVIAVVLFPLVMAGHRRARWWLTIAVLWLYALFTGLSPSVCRADIMASAVLLALIFDRPRSSLNALCLAAILILVFSPLSLMQPGFQLSFAATLAIILYSPVLAPVSRRSRYYRLLVPLAATLAATLGTFPLVAWHFHSVPVYFLVANVAAVAVMPVMIAGGVVLTMLLLFGIEPSWLVMMLDGVYSLFDGVVDRIARWPGATVGNIYPDAWLLIPMYLALAFLCAFLYLRHRCYAVLAVATLLFAVGAYAATRPAYADGEAYMLRSHGATSIAMHDGDTLRVLTLAPAHGYGYDSLMWSRRYRDYMATRGISYMEVAPLDSAVWSSGGVIDFGRRRMLVAHAMPANSVVVGKRHADYCLVTARWYGNPVELYRSTDADTIVLSSDMNRRRRLRYYNELTAAGIPVIDLGERPLSSY